jgi:cholesterol transport system auxiliary component
MTSTRICRQLVPALVAMAWVGCASGPAPRDHFYRLEVATPQAFESPSLAGTLEVDRLRVEAVNQERQILYRDASRGGEIAQHAYHHWVDTPSVMLQDQLVQYLRAANVAENVVTPAIHVESDYLVTGRIIRFERLLGGGEPRVAVEIELALLRTKDRDLLLLENYREERTAAGAGVAAAVTALGQATSAIFERFVADIAGS